MPERRKRSRDSETEGAASTALKAKDNINNEEELIIINSDQYLECDLSNCISEFRKKNVDGGILKLRKNVDGGIFISWRGFLHQVTK